MDLRTTYMGLELRSPIVVSACPLSEDLDNILKMEDHGAGAVVLFSLFEEQIRQEHAHYDAIMAATNHMFAEAVDFFPELDDYHVGSAQYLELIRQAKERVDMPVIASLNGITNEGWIQYAAEMEAAGADGLEMNVFWIPADIRLRGEEVEARYLEIIRAVKAVVQIPVAFKLNPYFSGIAHFADQVCRNGADALVLFNRFYQPDFDIHKLKVLHNLRFSDAAEIRLPLLWIAVLYHRIGASLAATTGVQSANEVVKYLLAGADVAMTASALYKYGIGYLKNMHHDLKEWMQEMGFTSVEAFKGVMSQQNISDPVAYERANYIHILENAKP
ncbi:MAG TPA: dihydroorotate dehydrogenase-like protein [Bacteroidetes bacterium]|nr:dihydroorotate dehydrogenase-like protein [Bacteroidota bacterium]